MTDTTHLALPFIDAAQAQKHVTHNDALQILDALVQLAATTRDVNAPPASPAEGARVVVGASPTGVFAGHANAVATWRDGAWRFLTPRAGWLAYVESETLLRVFDGAQWRDASDGFHAFANLDRLGVGTTADSTNPLSAKLNATLFTARPVAESGTGDLRFKLNKSAAANVLSQLYQDNFSGRAETGLIGDDHFRVKVSADGSAWREAIDIDPATGAVGFPSGVGQGGLAGFRNRLVNGAFVVNQRGYASGGALVAGAYAHDRWKAGAGGCAYAFTQTTPDTTITITSGSLLQIIEGSNVEGGTFVLSWSGGAQGRVNGGSYAPSPLVVTGLSFGGNVTIEFNTGVLGKVQFEPGSASTNFERRPLAIETAMCQRYFQAFIASAGGTLQISTHAGAAAAVVGATMPTLVSMRASPSASLVGTWTGSNFSAQPTISPDRTHVFLSALATAAGLVQCAAPVGGGFRLDAEL